MKRQRSELCEAPHPPSDDETEVASLIMVKLLCLDRTLPTLAREHGTAAREVLCFMIDGASLCHHNTLAPAASTDPTSAPSGGISVSLSSHPPAVLAASSSSSAGAPFRRKLWKLASSGGSGSAASSRHVPCQITIVEEEVWMDTEKVEWEVWDSDFRAMVPLTSEAHFCTLLKKLWKEIAPPGPPSDGVPVACEAHREVEHHLVVVCPLTLHFVSRASSVAATRHAQVTSALPHDRHFPAMTREATFLGTAAMVRLPTSLHHSHQSPLASDPVHDTDDPSHEPLTTTTPATSKGLDQVRIFLIRHGESEGNVNLNIYDSTPDHAIPLTERGYEMARGAGAFLLQYLTERYGSKDAIGHHVRMLVSPYQRTRETARGILEVLNGKDSTKPPAAVTLGRGRGGGGWVDSVKELPCLAEQDLGLCEGTGKEAKSKYTEVLQRIDLQRSYRGKFWSRFPQGESVFDVAVRMSGAFSEIISGCSAQTHREPIRTYIIVSHGVTIRAFLAAWCQKSPEWIAESVNPPNCSVQLIEDTAWKGYVFGGFDGAESKSDSTTTTTDRGLVPIDPNSISILEDPRRDAWDQFLR